MPKFLEEKLEKEYGKGDPRVNATMNSIGAMHGNKETAKGREMEEKHERDRNKRKHSSDGVGHWSGH